MQRVSLYNEIHKGLRSELMTLLIDCARTAPRNVEAIEKIAKRFRSLRAMLTEHATHEDKWVEPLVRNLRPDIADALHSEHTKLDAMLEEVDASFTRWQEAVPDQQLTTGDQTHRALAAFVGAYVSHMSREEDEAMPVLQAAMTDQQLLEVTGQLRGAIPPERMGEYIAIMLPAMNLEERSAMFHGLKANAPEPVFAGMCALASGVLRPADWSAVQTRVGL